MTETFEWNENISLMPTVIIKRKIKDKKDRKEKVEKSV